MEEYLDSRNLQEELENSKDEKRIKEIKTFKNKFDIEKWQNGITFYTERQFKDKVENFIHCSNYVNIESPIYKYFNIKEYAEQYKLDFLYDEVIFEDLIYLYKKVI